MANYGFYNPETGQTQFNLRESMTEPTIGDQGVMDTSLGNPTFGAGEESNNLRGYVNLFAGFLAGLLQKKKEKKEEEYASNWQSDYGSSNYDKYMIKLSRPDITTFQYGPAMNITRHLKDTFKKFNDAQEAREIYESLGKQIEQAWNKMQQDHPEKKLVNKEQYRANLKDYWNGKRIPDYTGMSPIHKVVNSYPHLLQAKPANEYDNYEQMRFNQAMAWNQAMDAAKANLDRANGRPVVNNAGSDMGLDRINLTIDSSKSELSKKNITDKLDEAEYLKRAYYKKTQETTGPIINSRNREARKELIVQNKSKIISESRKNHIPPELIAGILINEAPRRNDNWDRKWLDEPASKEFDNGKRKNDSTVGIAQISAVSALVEIGMNFKPIRTNDDIKERQKLREIYSGHSPAIIKVRQEMREKLYNVNYSIEYLTRLISRVKIQKFGNKPKLTDNELGEIIRQYNGNEGNLISKPYFESFKDNLPYIRNWLK